jgi:hydroxymethylpyrimidine/phosphomethylpyrimidine kinase
MPAALAIAGVDPSGGAGLFADLRAFAAAGAWGCGVPTINTIQSTAGMRGGRALATRDVIAQLREIASTENVRSIKIGALGSATSVRAILLWLREVPKLPVVLDPVMLPSRGRRGARLLDRAGMRILQRLATQVFLVTPNVPEAEALTGTTIRSIADAERAARALVEAGSRAALVKGGHLPVSAGRGKTVDVLAVGSRVVHFSAPRLAISVHGTGCTLASLIAGRMAERRIGVEASDQSIIDAVRWAKNRLQRALRQPARIGAGHLVLPL